MMADGAGASSPGKAPWVLTLLLVGAASGALARYPLLTASSGLNFVVLFAAFLALLGLPLVLAEAAFGQFRRRNVVDAFGPGPWKVGGFVLATAALLTAVLLAMMGGWFARYVVASFQGTFFDDPERHFRLLATGWDAMLCALAVVAVATGLQFLGKGRGPRATFAVTAIVSLVVLAGLAAWGLLQEGSTAGRRAFLSIHLDAIDAKLVVQAALQALLPVAVGLGVVATWSSTMHDRTLPRDATTLLLLVAGLPLLAGLFLVTLASANGQTLGSGDHFDDLFTAIPALFASLDAFEAGVLSGLFYGVLLAVSIAAVNALIKVPAAWLAEQPGWKPQQGALAAGLAVALVAVFFAFSVDAVRGLHLFLAGIVAPLGGLLVAVQVGWMRPQVLDGLRVGDARHELDATLRPYLRYVVPPILAFLLLIGLMAFLADAGAIERGASGLWRVVP